MIFLFGKYFSFFPFFPEFVGMHKINIQMLFEIKPGLVGITVITKNCQGEGFSCLGNRSELRIRGLGLGMSFFGVEGIGI